MIGNDWNSTILWGWSLLKGHGTKLQIYHHPNRYLLFFQLGLAQFSSSWNSVYVLNLLGSETRSSKLSMSHVLPNAFQLHTVSFAYLVSLMFQVLD